MLPKITFIPPSCKRFFRHARKKSRDTCHRDHLWRVVLLIASTHGHRSLSKVEKATGCRRTRQAISHCLSQAEWDARSFCGSMPAIRCAVGWRTGDLLYLILDDTQKRKRAKRMDAVSKLFLHAEKNLRAWAYHRGLRAGVSRRGDPLCRATLGAEGFCRKTVRRNIPIRP